MHLSIKPAFQSNFIDILVLSSNSLSARTSCYRYRYLIQLSRSADTSFTIWKRLFGTLTWLGYDSASVESDVHAGTSVLGQASDILRSKWTVWHSVKIPQLWRYSLRGATASLTIRLRWDWAMNRDQPTMKNTRKQRRERRSVLHWRTISSHTSEPFVGFKRSK